MSQNRGASPTLSWTPVSQGPHLAEAAGAPNTYLTGNPEPSPQVRSAARETRRAGDPCLRPSDAKACASGQGQRGVLGKDTALLSLSLVWGFLPL